MLWAFQVEAGCFAPAVVVILVEVRVELVRGEAMLAEVLEGAPDFTWKGEKIV